MVFKKFLRVFSEYSHCLKELAPVVSLIPRFESLSTGSRFVLSSEHNHYWICLPVREDHKGCSQLTKFVCCEL